MSDVREGGSLPGERGVDPDVRIFSSTKHKIMMTVKRDGESDLENLSRKLRISKMAAYKHVKELERRGLLEHETLRRGVGRPRLIFKPTANSSAIYPSAYKGMALASLALVERELGRQAAVGFLGSLDSGSVDDYVKAVGEGSLLARTKRLAQARDSGGHMAEVVETRAGIELAEHNCPISAAAARYPEVCEAEREMFEKILGAKVERVSSSLQGDVACRFRITPT